MDHGYPCIRQLFGHPWVAQGYIWMIHWDPWNINGSPWRGGEEEDVVKLPHASVTHGKFQGNVGRLWGNMFCSLFWRFVWSLPSYLEYFGSILDYFWNSDGPKPKQQIKCSTVSQKFLCLSSTRLSLVHLYNWSWHFLELVGRLSLDFLDLILNWKHEGR